LTCGCPLRCGGADRATPASLSRPVVRKLSSIPLAKERMLAA